MTTPGDLEGVADDVAGQAAAAEDDDGAGFRHRGPSCWGRRIPARWATATAWAWFCTWSLANIRCLWLSTVFGLTSSSWALCWRRQAGGDVAEHLVLAWRQHPARRGARAGRPRSGAGHRLGAPDRLEQLPDAGAVREHHVDRRPGRRRRGRSGGRRVGRRPAAARSAHGRGRRGRRRTTPPPPPPRRARPPGRRPRRHGRRRRRPRRRAARSAARPGRGGRGPSAGGGALLDDQAVVGKAPPRTARVVGRSACLVTSHGVRRTSPPSGSRCSGPSCRSTP